MAELARRRKKGDGFFADSDMISDRKRSRQQPDIRTCKQRFVENPVILSSVYIPSAETSSGATPQSQRKVPIAVGAAYAAIEDVPLEFRGIKPLLQNCDAIRSSLSSSIAATARRRRFSRDERSE